MICWIAFDNKKTGNLFKLDSELLCCPMWTKVCTVISALGSHLLELYTSDHFSRQTERRESECKSRAMQRPVTPRKEKRKRYLKLNNYILLHLFWDKVLNGKTQVENWRLLLKNGVSVRVYVDRIWFRSKPKPRNAALPCRSCRWHFVTVKLYLLTTLSWF